MRAKERGGQAEIWKRTGNGGAVDCCAECYAIVASDGLDVNLVEEAGAGELAVGGAVEGDAAGHGDAAQAGLKTEVAADMKDYPVEAGL